MSVIELMVGTSIALNVILLLLVLTGGIAKNLKDFVDQQITALARGQERFEKMIRDELATARQEWAQANQRLSETLDTRFRVLSETLGERIHDFSTATQQLLSGHEKHQSELLSQLKSDQKDSMDSFRQQIADLTNMNARKLDGIRETVDSQLAALQKDNSEKLEKMRQTVDEKLHQTLEQRLGDSFRRVSESLERVQKGLGEMQTLATGVGDLKKVLTNVKTRGTLGEVQLNNILEQIMTRDQYEVDAQVKTGSSERVDFAIRFPGSDHVVLLPIDAKFPLSDYQELVDAQEAGDLTRANEAAKQLENRIRAEARSIRDKYINPPVTTDFALMFLPIEGLVAEVFRRPGLWDSVQRDHHVVVTGPTTITALLNSFQLGFRTLAIQKRSSEVWELLGAVKTEFGKFGEILEKTKKKLQEASNTIDTAASKSRTIERKLKGVESLPPSDAMTLIEPLDAVGGE